MRIALLSDVHANLTALEAVLAAIAARGPDAIVFAGDVCLAGPRPAERFALLEERCTAMITGNTDAVQLRPARQARRSAVLVVTPTFPA